MNQQFYRNMALWVVILVMVLLLITMLRQSEPPPPEKDFTEFLAMVESSQEGILAYDSDLCFTIWNPAMEQISGVGADEVIGKTISEAGSSVEELSCDDALADAAKGKTVVFYCSVGVRSSKLAARLQKALTARGAKAVYNLQAGIFNWHNEHRPLTTGSAPTSFVHPFDDHWGQLVERRDLLSYRPAN